MRGTMKQVAATVEALEQKHRRAHDDAPTRWGPIKEDKVKRLVEAAMRKVVLDPVDPAGGDALGNHVAWTSSVGASWIEQRQQMR